jgi:hypothetical protein
MDFEKLVTYQVSSLEEQQQTSKQVNLAKHRCEVEDEAVRLHFHGSSTRT